MRAPLSVAEKLMRTWPEGECHYCHVRDGDVDGDRLRWLGPMRRVCNRHGCVNRFYSDVDRAELAERRAKRKRTPAEIHELKAKERRERRLEGKAKR